METEAETEAAVAVAGDGQHPQRAVRMNASSDARRALAQIAQQRRVFRRRTRLKYAAQALFLVAALGAVWTVPRFRERSLAAEPVRSKVYAVEPASAPPTAAATAALTAAPGPAATPSLAAPPSSEPQAPPVATPEDPAELCESHYKARQWRNAMHSCGASFDATPTPELAMRVAHARYAHGDTAGAGTWAQNALELGSRDPDAYVLLGHAEQAAGKPGKALAAYRRYLELAPRGWHAERLRSLTGAQRASGRSPVPSEG